MRGQVFAVLPQFLERSGEAHWCPASCVGTNPAAQRIDRGLGTRARVEPGDQRCFTGESIPRSLELGDRVLVATLDPRQFPHRLTSPGGPVRANERSDLPACGFDCEGEGLCLRSSCSSGAFSFAATDAGSLFPSTSAWPSASLSRRSAGPSSARNRSRRATDSACAASDFAMRSRACRIGRKRLAARSSGAMLIAFSPLVRSSGRGSRSGSAHARASGSGCGTPLAPSPAQLPRGEEVALPAARRESSRLLAAGVSHRAHPRTLALALSSFIPPRAAPGSTASRLPEVP
jgi:hypothetical protein